jgi:hypothetical protein
MEGKRRGRRQCWRVRERERLWMTVRTGGRGRGVGRVEQELRLHDEMYENQS